MNPCTGLLTREGVPGNDGRVIDADTLTWEPDDRGAIVSMVHHDDRRLVGRVDTVTRDNDGAIRITGATVLPPGDYPIGFDVQKDVGDGLRLMTVCVSCRPCWPDAVLTVTAG